MAAATVRMLSGVALAAAFWAPAFAEPPFAPSHLARPPPPAALPARSRMVEPSPGTPIILEPAYGAHAPIGRLRLRIGGELRDARSAQIEMTKTQHEPGVLGTTFNWPEKVSDLEAGIWLPREA